MWVDSSPILAGALSHYALISGLHTSGSLQDFSRTVMVENDSVSRDRVWAICITVCQRYIRNFSSRLDIRAKLPSSVCMTAGIPLPLIPTHRTNLLNEELAFDVQLYSLQAKALAHLEEARTAQASLIWNVVEHYRNELINLDSTCPSNIRKPHSSHTINVSRPDCEHRSLLSQRCKGPVDHVRLFGPVTADS